MVYRRRSRKAIQEEKLSNVNPITDSNAEPSHEVGEQYTIGAANKDAFYIKGLSIEEKRFDKENSERSNLPLKAMQVLGSDHQTNDTEDIPAQRRYSTSSLYSVSSLVDLDAMAPEPLVIPTS